MQESVQKHRAEQITVCLQVVQLQLQASVMRRGARLSCHFCRAALVVSSSAPACLHYHLLILQGASQVSVTSCFQVQHHTVTSVRPLNRHNMFRLSCPRATEVGISRVAAAVALPHQTAL